jgi:nucleoside-diphosphate-sugar epimerase
MKVVITGAAGLVGQNLIAHLKARGDCAIVAIDKHAKNLAILRALHPDVTAIDADLAERGSWPGALDGADAVVICHAQIGGLAEAEFRRNNVQATERLLDALAARGPCHLVHVSSSVVNSAVVDWYTESKKAQEQLVLSSGNPCIVLRPTLMFGWFDRKHFGWLSRFMRRSPIFPVPGSGRYLRQPLYVGDFCRMIMSCIDHEMAGGIYDISGLEKMYYIDIIREIKRVTRARARIVRIPYGAFHAMLRLWSLVDRDPPFTTQQLAALIAPDEFDVIDWPALFGVTPTPFAEAIEETFGDARYAKVVLEF